MICNQIFTLLEDSTSKPQLNEGIWDFVAEDCQHKKIGQAYDKAAAKYDGYISGNSFLLKTLKKIALGLDEEAAKSYKVIIGQMLAQINEGIVLDVPAGTGLYSFEEYSKHPQILFIAVEYSMGMLRQAQTKIKELGAKNILLVRADVGCLPFKSAIFDAAICLNGIHSFPDKARAIKQMSRVLKSNKKLHGSLVLKGERWLTDFILEAAYFRLGWFARPALTRQEFFVLLEQHGLKTIKQEFLKAAAVFEANKLTS